MVHISSTQLQEATLKKLRSRFADSIATVKKNDDAVHFLDELLGPEEQIMLAKRLAAIYMLSEGISAYRIAQVLGLSTSTVNKMYVIYESSGYVTIVENYRHKKNHAEFWEDIEVLLRLGMPPRGKGRWKWLYELERKQR